jgi:hypothetical protein
MKLHLKIIFTITLFIFALKCNSPNQTNSKISENLFNEFNENDFYSAINRNDKIFVVLLYYATLDDNWYSHYLHPLVNYHDKVIAGKLNYTKNNKFVKCCDPYYAIFKDSTLFRLFDIKTPYWQIKTVVDSILNIELPDTCPKITLSWEKYHSNLPFSLQSYSTAILLKNKLHILHVKYNSDLSDSISAVFSTLDGVNWQYVPSKGKMISSTKITIDNDTVWGTTKYNAYYVAYTQDTLSFNTFSVVGDQYSSNSIVKRNDTLFSIGGRAGDKFGGIRFTKIQNNSSWIQLDASEYYGHVTTYFNGFYHLIGGYYRWEIKDYTLSSIDLERWDNRSNIYSYGFTPRSHTSLLHYKNLLLIFGGFNDTFALNDIFLTRSGIDWYKAKQINNFTPLYSTSAIYFNGKIWLIGGYGNEGYSDEIWLGTIVNENL